MSLIRAIASNHDIGFNPATTLVGGVIHLIARAVVDFPGDVNVIVGVDKHIHFIHRIAGLGYFGEAPAAAIVIAIERIAGVGIVGFGGAENSVNMAVTVEVIINALFIAPADVSATRDGTGIKRGVIGETGTVPEQEGNVVTAAAILGIAEVIITAVIHTDFGKFPGAISRDQAGLIGRIDLSRGRSDFTAAIHGRQINQIILAGIQATKTQRGAVGRRPAGRLQRRIIIAIGFGNHLGRCRGGFVALHQHSIHGGRFTHADTDIKTAAGFVQDTGGHHHRCAHPCVPGAAPTYFTTGLIQGCISVGVIHTAPGEMTVIVWAVAGKIFASQQGARQRRRSLGL